MDESPRYDDLGDQEVRVLGCLVEKESTTPDAYPLTLNSLRLACNQSTSRDPVVSYTDHDVERALTSLRGRGLTRIVHSTSNRAAKFRHVLDDALQLERAELALLSVLLLRGPQTPGELRTRTNRLCSFTDVKEVETILDGLAHRGSGPLVVKLPREPGKRESRYQHLFSGEVDVEDLEQTFIKKYEETH